MPSLTSLTEKHGRKKIERKGPTRPWEMESNTFVSDPISAQQTEIEQSGPVAEPQDAPVTKQALVEQDVSVTKQVRVKRDTAAVERSEEHNLVLGVQPDGKNGSEVLHELDSDSLLLLRLSDQIGAEAAIRYTVLKRIAAKRDGLLSISQQAIAAALRISDQSARRLFAMLEDEKLVTVVQDYDPKIGTPKVYKFLEI